MIKKRDHKSLLIEANIEVKTLKEMGFKNFIGVRYDTRLAFYVNGLHYDGVVEKCENTIAPGATGRVTFLTLSDALLGTNVAVGSRVELRRGAALVAVAEILSIRRVFVKSDPSSERGYVILVEEGREHE